MREQAPAPVNGKYLLHVLVFPAPVGAAARADGQEEDEKEMDEGKKEPDWQVRDSIRLIVLFFFFLVSSLLSLCLFQTKK